MLDLNDLRVFAYVASLKSFSLAADELEINKSSVSRSISRLERMLNAPLLQRTTRKVHLTHYGTALQQRCDEMLTRVGEPLSFAAIAAIQPQDRLTVCVDSGLGLAAELQNRLLPRFAEGFLEVRPSVRYTSSKAALRGNDVDIAVFLDSPSAIGHCATVSRHLYAAPDYLLRRGVPASSADLQDHDLIASDDADDADRPAGLAHKGTITESRFKVDARTSIISNEPLAMHGLVSAGVGIGCLLDHLCQDDVRSGRLVRLLPELRFPPLRVNLAFPSSRQAEPAVEAFAALLRTELKQRQA